jgi:hypothetical protein
MSLDAAIADLVSVHDRSLQAWDQAFQTGDTTLVESFPAVTYEGFFGHVDVERVEPVDRAEAVLGIRRFAGAVHPATHSTQGRIIRMRSETEGVVFYERVIEKDGRSMAKFLVLQSWRKISDTWQVVREVAEHFG